MSLILLFSFFFLFLHNNIILDLYRISENQPRKTNILRKSLSDKSGDANLLERKNDARTNPAIRRSFTNVARAKILSRRSKFRLSNGASTVMCRRIM